MNIKKNIRKIFNIGLYPESFQSRNDLKIWLNENNIKYKSYHIFHNDDWCYVDEQGYHHVYRDGKELTKGIKAKDVHSYNNGDWQYTDKQGFDHFFRDGIELTKDVKAKYAWSFDNGDWEYMDEQGNLHEFDKDNNKIN